MNELGQLRDLVLAQQDSIDKIVGQNMALRTVLLALVATHQNRRAFAEQFDRMREASTARSLYVAAQDASLAEAERWLDELSRPWHEER